MPIVFDKVGSVKVEARVTDSKGVVHYTDVGWTYTIKEPPTVTGTLSSDNWLDDVTASSSVTLKYTTTSGGVGVDHVQLHVTRNGSWYVGNASQGEVLTASSGQRVFSEPGYYRVWLYVIPKHNTDLKLSMTGNIPITFYIESPPTVSLSVTTEEWTNSDVRVRFSYTSGHGISEVDKIYYRVTLNGVVGSWKEIQKGYGITYSTSGDRTIEAKVVDVYGRESPIVSKKVRIDKVKPAGGIAGNTENWQSATSVTVTLNAGDSLSGVKTAKYRLEGATTKGWTDYSNGEKISITNEGETAIYIHVTDNAGSTYILVKDIRIDRTNPTGSIVIDKGQDFLNNEETTLHLKFDDLVSGNNAASGVHTLRVFDVNGTYSATFTNPTGTSLSIPWVLVPWEATDGALKAQVGVEITDRAGNKVTVYSQVVEIIKVYVTKFELLNVLNPTVYHEKNPFTVLTYPNIPPQPLLSGAHFTYHFEYYHPKNVNSKWKIDYISTVYYDKPNGQKEVWPIKDLKQSVTGMYSFQHIIPYHMPKGTKVYLDLQLVLYDASGRKVAEGHFPQPMNTSLYLGQIEGDIRETLQFNEFN